MTQETQARNGHWYDGGRVASRYPLVAIKKDGTWDGLFFDTVEEGKSYVQENGVDLYLVRMAANYNAEDDTYDWSGFDEAIDEFKKVYELTAEGVAADGEQRAADFEASADHMGAPVEPPFEAAEISLAEMAGSVEDTE